MTTSTDLTAVAIVRASGELDIETAPGLSEQLRRALADGEGAIVLDLTSVTFIDSTGLAVLLNMLRRMTRAGRAFALAVAPGPVSRALALTRMDTSFRIFDTAELAAERLAAPASGARAAG